MNKIDLYNIGLSNRFKNEATMYEGNLYLARVSVQHKDMYKVITEEGLGFTGTGEGISSQAICLLTDIQDAPVTK